MSVLLYKYYLLLLFSRFPAAGDSSDWGVPPLLISGIYSKGRIIASHNCCRSLLAQKSATFDLYYKQNAIKVRNVFFEEKKKKKNNWIPSQSPLLIAGPGFIIIIIIIIFFIFFYFHYFYFGGGYGVGPGDACAIALRWVCSLLHVRSMPVFIFFYFFFLSTAYERHTLSFVLHSPSAHAFILVWGCISQSVILLYFISIYFITFY